MKIKYREERHADLPHVVKASGGKSSGMMLLKLLEAGMLKPERGDIAVFNNTSAEHQLTYDFIRGFRKRVIQYGLPFFFTEYQSYERYYQKRWARTRSYRIVHPQDLLQDGSIYEELVSHQGFMPTLHRRICTTWLKVRPTEWLVQEWLEGKTGIEELGSERPLANPEQAWETHVKCGGKRKKDEFLARRSFVMYAPSLRPAALFSDYTGTGQALNQGTNGNGEYVSLIGLRYDEPRRIERVTCSTRIPNEHSYAPLGSNRIHQQDVVKFWQKQPKPHPAPSHLNNCTFCFLKGKSILRQAQRDDPEGLKWWQKMEHDYGSFLGKGNPPLFDDIENSEQMEISLPCECVD